MFTVGIWLLCCTSSQPFRIFSTLTLLKTMLQEEWQRFWTEIMKKNEEDKRMMPRYIFPFRISVCYPSPVSVVYLQYAVWLQERPFQVKAYYISAFCVCMYRRLYLTDFVSHAPLPPIILSVSWLPICYNGCCNIFIYSSLDTVLWARA